MATTHTQLVAPFTKHMVRLRLSNSNRIYPPQNFTCNWNLISNPSNQKWLSPLKSCSSMKQLFQIHAQILISGLHSDKYIIHGIIQFCTFHRLGSLCYARLVIEHSKNSTPSSWNNLIRLYATTKFDNCDFPRETIWIFNGMRRSESRPDELTYPFLFKACAFLSALEEGRQIQADVLKRGLNSDVYVQNTLIHFYGSCKKIVDARQVFDEMSYRTVVSWNSIITAFIQVSRFYESIQFFVKMRCSGFEPDKTTMVGLLSVCAEIGNLSLGKWVHSQIIAKGLELNCQLGTAIVDMYAKCGLLNSAHLVFERMPQRNVWTWSAMILGLAQHGFATEAIALFTRMKNASIRPNYVTFLGVICACSHAGLVDDGYRFFHEMKHVYSIKPLLIHYGAMVDVLGRAGHLKEAYDFIMNMPIKPDPTVWRTLLGACINHDTRDYDGVGEKVRNRLLKLEPRRGGNLVILANKYAEDGKWEKAAQVRRSIRHRGLKKMAGESCIEIGGSIFRFFSGDESQVAFENIFLLLHGLNLQMKMLYNG